MKRMIVKSLELILYGSAVVMILSGMIAGGSAGGFIGFLVGSIGGFIFSVLLLGFFFMFLEMNQSLRDIRDSLANNNNS